MENTVNNDMHSLLEPLQDQVPSITTSVVEIVQQVTTLTNDFKLYREQTADEFEELRKEVTQVRSDTNALKQNMTTLQGEMGAMRSEMADLKRSVDNFIQEIRASRPKE